MLVVYIIYIPPSCWQGRWCKVDGKAVKSAIMKGHWPQHAALAEITRCSLLFLLPAIFAATSVDLLLKLEIFYSVDIFVFEQVG